MTIELNQLQEQQLQRLISSGKFDSAEAVLELALKTFIEALEQPQLVDFQEAPKKDFKKFLESMPVDLDFVERDKSLARTVEL